MTADDPAITRMRACPHTGFYALDHPMRPMEECPDCGRILRTLNDAQSRIDYAAEERQDRRAYELAHLEDREEMSRS